jgi:hypothetical protein
LNEVKSGSRLAIWLRRPRISLALNPGYAFR